MSFISQMVAQARPDNTDITTILSGIPGGTIEIKTIMLANTSKNDAGITVYQAADTETFTDDHIIAPQYAITGYGYVLIEGWFPMSSSAYMGVRQTSAGAINVTVWGVII